MSGEQRHTIKILLVDSQHVIREGIRRIFEVEPDLQVVGEAEDGEEAIRLTKELGPDVVLMEAQMPGFSGFEIARRINEYRREVAVIVFTAYDEEEHIVGLLGAGVAGYLLKSTRNEELAQAVRFGASGEFVADLKRVQKLYRRATRRAVAVNAAEHLTNRELQVLKLAAKGMSNRDIGYELGVGLRTVKGYFESICGKMGVKSRTEAVLEALKRDWVSLGSE